MPDHDISFGYQPGQEIGYDQITATVTVTSTTEATGTTVITCAAHYFDGSPVMVEFFMPIMDPPTANNDYIISLFEGATQIGRLWHYFNTGQSYSGGCMGRFRFTPAAGYHTYTVTAYKTGAATPSVGAGAGGTGAHVPAFVRFTKV